MRKTLSLIIPLLFLSTITLAQTNETSVCPSITVTAPAGIIDWEALGTFIASLNEHVPNVTYSWTISKGEIVSGQGTPSLQMRIPKTYDMRIIATVTVGGLPPRCPNTASTMYAYAIDPGPILIDEYGPIPIREEFSHLRAGSTQLKKNLNSMLYLVLYPGKFSRSFKKRNKVIGDYLTRVLHMNNLFKIVIGPNIGFERTKIYIVPPGSLYEPDR